MSRAKQDSQGWLEFRASNLAVTCEYFRKYEVVSEILDSIPELVDLVHRDLQSFDRGRSRGLGPAHRYTSDQVLRMLVCQHLEHLSLRECVVRIDDSACLRRFTRIHGGSMMDYSTLCRLRNAIRAETWEKINHSLAAHAVAEELITGQRLRMDTTAVETNTHWPSDSHLLWDVYRVLGQLIESVRAAFGSVVGGHRLRTRDMKRCHTLIGRIVRRGRVADQARKPYKRLIEGVEAILGWSEQLAECLERIPDRKLSSVECNQRDQLAQRLRHYIPLGAQVVWQASQRVLEGKKVPAAEKLFSIFEPHTEMLLRGKASRNIEYGHMVGIEQVGGKFITHYEVFAKKPNEHELLLPALERHRKMFREYPDQVTADRGYWPGVDQLPIAESKVNLVSIGKMGKRNEDDVQRESEPAFRESQKFRAGVEGTIAFLKRVLGLARCLRKTWSHFVCEVGETIFAHNLLILARC